MKSLKCTRLNMTKVLLKSFLTHSTTILSGMSSKNSTILLKIGLIGDSPSRISRKITIELSMGPPQPAR